MQIVQKMLVILNTILKDPLSYFDTVENSIKYILQESEKDNETKTKLIFKKM